MLHLSKENIHDIDEYFRINLFDNSQEQGFVLVFKLGTKQSTNVSNISKYIQHASVKY